MIVVTGVTNSFMHHTMIMMIDIHKCKTWLIVLFIKRGLIFCLRNRMYDIVERVAVIMMLIYQWVDTVSY